MYYCDANQVGGAFCPEFDIMEANIWAYRGVNHHCDEPNNGHYTDCDRHGTCAVDVITDFPGNIPYGPGSQYTINSEREFHIKIDFTENDLGEFIRYSITLSQDGRQVTMNQDCPEYLQKVTDVMKNGMTIAMSIWSSGNLDWLQHGRCQGGCGTPDLKLKNFKFTTKNANTDDGDNSDDNNNSDDDEPVGNPLEGYKTEAPASMGRAQPRYTKEGKKKVLDEALDYDAISGK